jgi:uncharacterized protein
MNAVVSAVAGVRPSRYVITVPLRDGRHLAYCGLSGAFAVWEPHEHAVFEAMRTGEEVRDLGVVQELLYGGFVVREEVDELSVLRREYEAHRFSTDNLMLTIAPTLACNFGCDYCFQGHDKPTQTMKPEVEDAILAYIRSQASGLRSVGIAWYGGEPLLKVEVIERLSDRLIALCRELGLVYSAMIVTNGFRLTADVARSLYDRGVRQAQITLDGDAEYHDSRRHLLSGGPTFERIVTNLKAVVAAVPLKLSIRVNIDGRNRDDIPGLIDRLAAEGLSHNQNFRLYFAPVEAMTVGCHSVEDACMSKRDYGQLEAGLYRHAFDRGLTALPYPPRFHGVCGAVRPYSWVITPTGDLHKCWDTVTFSPNKLGTIFEVDKAMRTRRFEQWTRWTPFDNDSCRNCKLLTNCAGACAYKFLHADDTRGEAATLPCPSWKYNIKERLLLRAEKMGIITAADYDLGAVFTDPSELCTDDHIGGGHALPAPMQALYAR